jgi:hypothetical protein
MFQSCACHIITRVNKVELPSLFRLRSARKFIAELPRQIIAAQGELPDDWIERSGALEELSTSAGRNPDKPVDPLPAGQFSWLTVSVFLFVLIDGALTFAQVCGIESPGLSNINMLNMALLAICATIAIVRLSRQKNVRALRIFVLGGLLAVAGATYGGMMLESIDQQIFHETMRNPVLYTGMRALNVAEIVFDAVIAIPGLILAFRQTQIL